MGALFFAVALWTRRMFWTYLGVILFVTLQDVVEALTNQAGTRWLGALAEPLGLNALKLEARYWTVSEYSESVLPLFSLISVNRLVWLALGAGFLTLGWLRFNVARAAGAKGRTPDEGSESVPESASALPVVRPSAGPKARLQVLLGQCRFEVAWVVRSPFLLVCALLAMILVSSVAWPTLLLAAPCLLIQVLVRGKFLGYLLLVGLFTLRFAMPLLGLESPLYLYGQHPPVALAYSERWSGGISRSSRTLCWDSPCSPGERPRSDGSSRPPSSTSSMSVFRTTWRGVSRPAALRSSASLSSSSF